MKKNCSFSSCIASKNYRCIGRLILLAFLMLAQVSLAANHYVAFNNGNLIVFPDSCIREIRTADNQLIVTALDGKVYAYRLTTISSISEELPKPLPTITSYKFNNKYNFQIISDTEGVINGDTIDVEVIGIGKWLTASFSLSDDNARATVDGKEQVSKESRLHFDTTKTYTVGYPNDLILTQRDEGKYGFVPFGQTYTVRVDFLTDHNDVPSIYINTVGGVPISSKEYYLDAEIIIDGAGVFPSMTDSVQVKGRGHTSWSSNPDAKNPYRLKFASKKKPLGLKKGKSWVLLANKISGSMLTNAIGMKTASLIGTAAANHIIPVNLYVNGVYKGSYNFTEKVGLAGNSVEVEDETVATLLELDCNYDEIAGQKFKSKPYSIACNIKDPEFAEDSTLLTLELIKQRFNALCVAVRDSTDLAEHADIDYLARYLMLNELICNYEIFHPKSGYCYHENILDNNSKFIFGPGWDFDWAFGLQTQGNYYTCSASTDYYHMVNWGQSEFFGRLRNYPTVARRLYELWKDFVKNDLDELTDYCEEYFQYAKPSLELNKSMIGDKTNYANQCLRAANWLRNRSLALLEKMRAEVIKTGDADGNGEVNISDVTRLISYLLEGEEVTIDIDCADADDNGVINIDDVTALIAILLSNE